MILLNSNLFLTTYSFLLSYVGILNGDTSDRKSHLGVIKVYRFIVQFDTSPDCIDRKDLGTRLSEKWDLEKNGNNLTMSAFKFNVVEKNVVRK